MYEEIFLSIQHIAVIDAGSMGNAIAQICALTGTNVALLDVSDEALEKGVATLTANLERQVRKEALVPKTNRMPSLLQ
ncbi:hypothetical protein VC36_16995 [Pseudomonas marginalis]|nr:hypothetical protein VC37_12135 [Pseudomonas marginalis]KJZ58436.1 hypothetical protein VC36_16995 [Pseudomonas marginalis]